MALILEPTRELAVQVKKHLTTIAEFTDVQVEFALFNFEDLLYCLESSFTFRNLIIMIYFIIQQVEILLQHL